MKGLLFSILLGGSLGVEAAVPPNAAMSTEYTSIIESLQLPRKNRLVNLAKRPLILEHLHQLALDEKQSLKIRWRAITAMGEMAPLKSQPYLEKLLVRKEWFLRNAAMIGISHSDRPTVIKWAGELMNDRSLMVRTAAVQAIKKVKGVELQDLLWEKINSKENFHKGKSLWIRKYIADALASFAEMEKGEDDKFMKLLLDEDKRLHPFAIRGLSKATGKSVAPDKPLEQRRLAWIQHYKEKIQQ